MKCQNCGAEIRSGQKYCEYCGTQITADMQKKQEQLNKKGCPECGSTNVTFTREKEGELKDVDGTTILRSTVGVCKDCGYTWKVEEKKESEPVVKKRKTWLWILGWIFAFPIPLTILLLRPNNKLDKKIRYALVAILWIAVIVIGKTSKQEENASAKSEAISKEVMNTVTNIAESTEADIKTESTQAAQTSDGQYHLYDQVEVRDVMNGSRDTKIGEYAIIRADSSECTVEALADLYFNYYETNKFNWLMILYTDKGDDSGVCINSSILVNTKFEQDEYGDYANIGSAEEEMYFPDSETLTLKKVEFSSEGR